MLLASPESTVWVGKLSLTLQGCLACLPPDVRQSRIYSTCCQIQLVEEHMQVVQEHAHDTFGPVPAQGYSRDADAYLLCLRVAIDMLLAAAADAAAASGGGGEPAGLRQELLQQALHRWALEAREVGALHGHPFANAYQACKQSTDLWHEVLLHDARAALVGRALSTWPSSMPGRKCRILPCRYVGPRAAALV